MAQPKKGSRPFMRADDRTIYLGKKKPASKKPTKGGRIGRHVKKTGDEIREEQKRKPKPKVKKVKDSNSSDKSSKQGQVFIPEVCPACGVQVDFVEGKKFSFYRGHNTPEGVNCELSLKSHQ